MLFSGPKGSGHPSRVWQNAAWSGRGVRENMTRRHEGRILECLDILICLSVLSPSLTTAHGWKHVYGLELASVQFHLMVTSLSLFPLEQCSQSGLKSGLVHLSVGARNGVRDWREKNHRLTMQEWTNLTAKTSCSKQEVRSRISQGLGYLCECRNPNKHRHQGEASTGTPQRVSRTSASLWLYDTDTTLTPIL